MGRPEATEESHGGTKSAPALSAPTRSSKLGPVLERSEEVRERATESRAQSGDAVHGGGRLAAFELAHEGAVETGSRGQPFLRESVLGFAELTKAPAHRLVESLAQPGVVFVVESRHQDACTQQEVDGSIPSGSTTESDCPDEATTLGAGSS
jgi:hypothetical protein